MRDVWRRIDLAEVLRPASQPVAVGSVGEVPYAGVHWYGLGVYRRMSVDATTVKAATLTRIRAGQVVYNRMWATRGSFGVAEMDVDGCLVTNDFPVFDAVRGVEPRYLALWFQTPAFQSAAASSAVGTTERRRLHERDFLRLTIDLPSLAEQRRIVDLVSAVDEARSGRRMGAACSAVAAGLLQRIETDAETWTPLAEVVRVAKSGATPARAKPAYWGGPIPWLKSGEVDADHIRTTSEAITELGLAESSAWIMPVGTVVVAMYGQGLTSGSVGYLDAPMCANQAVLGLVSDERLAHGRFLFHWLRGHKEAMRERRTGSSQPNLNKELVLQEPIPVLDLTSQREAADLLDDLSATAVAAATLDDVLVRLRSTLLDALVSGEHEIPASYDRFLDGAA
jgi:type I restriction enzyme, S subunit